MRHDVWQKLALMRFHTFATAVVLSLLAAPIAASQPTVGGAPVPAAHCKVKKVHGKKRRVCAKPKPNSLPQAGKVAAKIPIDGQVVAIAADDTAVWVLSDRRVLSRVDPATNTVVATIPLRDSEWPESYVAIGSGSVWVTVASPSTIEHPELDSLLRIDPATNRIVATINVGHSPEGIGIARDSIWTANHRSESNAEATDATGAFTVSRVSVATNKEVARPVVEMRAKGSDPHAYWCCGPQGMTYAAGSIWTTDPQDSGNGLVQRVDPSTNAVLATISFATSEADACGNMVGDAGAVWFASSCDNPYVGRIDPQTNQIAATIYMGVGQATQDIALGFGSVWVTTLNYLSRIDPATNKIVARTVVAPASAIATGAGSVWVGSGMTLDRVTPG